MWNKEDAIKHLTKHANNHSLGRCAEYVRIAIEAGGVHLQRHKSAKDYGSSLIRVGFHEIVHRHADSHYHHRAGDVAVIQPIEGHPDGHMTMFSGVIWISDFKQFHGVYPGHAYRELKPSLAIYRYAF